MNMQNHPVVSQAVENGSAAHETVDLMTSRRTVGALFLLLLAGTAQRYAWAQSGSAAAPGRRGRTLTVCTFIYGRD